MLCGALILPDSTDQWLWILQESTPTLREASVKRKTELLTEGVVSPPSKLNDRSTTEDDPC